MNRDSVRVVFTVSNSLFGRAIRWFTSSKYSHVYLEFPVWGRRMALESTVGGTNVVVAERARCAVVAEFEIPGGDVANRAGLLAVASLFGTAYDYAGVLFLAWMGVAWKWFKTKVSKPKWSTKAAKCSEAMVYVFQALDIPDAGKLSKEMVSPQSIYDFCDAHPDNFVPVTGDTERNGHQ